MEKKEYTLAVFKPKDVFGVISLSREIFNSRESFESEEKVLEYIEKGFVAKNKSNEIVGYIFFDIITYYIDKPIFNIMALGVKKEYQNLGIGRNLLKEVIKYFDIMYYFNKRICNLERKIYLQVRCSNENAKHLYEKMGFRITKVINNFYEDPSENGYEMIYNFIV